ncbi:MAG TPA: hydroxymyristoyl-ACP dehydratase [Treponema sp.]|jgi:3-hydroxymyristoyl/3-hydroxydecanoyl-(acyl carrier protein) dehydratase|nr:hydroxymyristoyl-ACP dehydratase [Treponema sp.]
MTENNHGIENEVVVSRDETNVELEFVIPVTSDFFHGHFPQFKILPAVGQFEIVTRFSRKYLNTTRWVAGVRRMKFSAPVLPETKLRLKLSRDPAKNSVEFDLSGADDGKSYSNGIFTAEAQ